MKAIIPISSDQLDGPFITVSNEDDFLILAQRENALIVEFCDFPKCVDWFCEGVLMYCEIQSDGASFKVIREATIEEEELFRVPRWLQGPDIPDCCGRPMYSVGQITEPEIRMDPPPDAKYWWHDYARFYVFTCSQCLGCKAVGQQC